LHGCERTTEVTVALSGPGNPIRRASLRGHAHPVDHIVGPVRCGVDLGELREDYPTLGEADLAYATMLASMKADPGRPRKPLALIRQGAFPYRGGL